MLLLIYLVSHTLCEEVFEPPVVPVPYPKGRGDAHYNSIFKVPFDDASIASTIDSLKGTPIENALKNDTSFFESVPFKNPENVTITFPKPIEFDYFVFQSRTGTSRGFPLKYQLLVRYQGSDDFISIKNGQFFNYSSKIILIEFNHTITNVIEFRIRYITIVDYFGKSIGLTYLGLYHNDNGIELENQVFTDRTWSKFKDGMSKKVFEEKLNNCSEFVQKYLKEKKLLLDTIDEVDSMRPEMLEKDIFNFDCGGDVYSEQSRLRTGSVHHTYMTIGRYVLCNETIEMFCEFGNNTYMPAVKFLKSMDISSEGQAVTVKNGYTKAKSKSYRNTSSQVTFIMLECNRRVGGSGLFVQPKCRFKGGHKYPHYVLFKYDPQHYYDELEAYTKAGVSNYWEDAYNDSLKADCTNFITNKQLLLGSATGAYKGIKRNLPVETGLVSLIKKYDQYPYVYYQYGGFEFTPHGRFFSRLQNSYVYDLHAYMLPEFTAYNCYCLNQKDQTTGWSAVLFDIKQMTKSTDNSWGFFHEWGHGMDNTDFVIYEMTNNYYSQVLTRYVLNEGPTKHDPGINGLMSGYYGVKNYSSPEWNGMAQMRLLDLYFGGDFHGKVNNFTRKNINYDKCGFDKKKIGNNQHRWVVSCSCVAKLDLSQHFADIGWFDFNNDTKPIIQELKKNLSQFKKPAHPIKYITPAVRAYKGNGFKDNVRPKIISIKHKFNQSKTISFVLDDENSTKDLQGYEVRDMNKNPISFTTKSNINTRGHSEVEVIPYDKKLNPGKGVFFTIKGEIVEADRTGWTVKNLKGGEHDWGANGDLKNIIDGLSNTSYRNAGGYPNAFIFNLSKSVTFTGFTRTRRNDAFGNTNKYKLWISDNGVNYTQVNDNNDLNVISTGGTVKEYYFFPGTRKAKFVKFEQLSTTGGDSHFGLTDFNLVSGFEFDYRPSTNNYPKANEPLPDISKIVDPPFVEEPTEEKGELYSCYPDIEDQPCYAKLEDTKTHRKSKIINRNAALYAINTVEKLVTLEIDSLKIMNSAKVISRDLAIIENLTIEQNSVLLSDYGYSISFDPNCEVNISAKDKFPVLDVGSINANKIPKSIRANIEFPLGSFNLKLIKGKQDALQKILDNNILSIDPEPLTEIRVKYEDGHIVVAGEKIDESQEKAKKEKMKIVLVSTIVGVVVVVCVIAVIVIIIIIKCRAKKYEESSDQMVI